MKLALFNDFRLGVIDGERIADAMSAVEGMSFRRPQDLMEEVIINWNEMRPRIEAAVAGQPAWPWAACGCAHPCRDRRSLSAPQSTT